MAVSVLSKAVSGLSKVLSALPMTVSVLSIAFQCCRRLFQCCQRLFQCCRWLFGAVEGCVSAVVCCFNAVDGRFSAVQSLFTSDDGHYLLPHCNAAFTICCLSVMQQSLSVALLSAALLPHSTRVLDMVNVDVLVGVSPLPSFRRCLESPCACGQPT